jgi:hypothetical protein
VGIYKRGEVYWYKFMWQGRSVRESTKQGNDKVAPSDGGGAQDISCKGRSWDSRKTTRAYP